MSGLIDSRDGLVFGDGLQFINGLGGGGLVVETVPSWVLAPGGVDPYVDIDFIGNRAWLNGAEVTIASIVTCARALPATTYYEQADGTLITFAANALRRGNRGLLVEESRTNVVLHSRDLTNAAWTKTNCTAVKDQTGPDGTVNGASSLTATADNATCRQAITLASSARWQSSYMKRLAGSGPIQMSMDNGSTWTAVSTTSSWGPVEIPTQTLANPTVGFRIVTNGDAVAIDFVQNENDNLQRSSPIPTTTGSVTRSADDVQLTSLGWINDTGMTIYGQGAGNVPNNSTPGGLYNLDHTSGSALIFARQTLSGMDYFGRNTAGTTQWVETIESTASVAQPSIRRQRATTSISANDIAMIGSHGTIATDTSAEVPTGMSRVSLFSQRTAQFWNGYGERFTAWNSALDDTNCLRLSASNCDFFIQFEGHSIPRSPTLSTSMAGYLRLTLPLAYIVRNYATSGATMANLTSREATVDAELGHFRAIAPSSAKQMLILVIGYNDFGVDGDSAATFLSQLYTYTDARRLAGHKVAVLDVTPSTTGGLNTWRATVNADLAANVGVRIDYHIDLSATSVGADSDASDVAKYPDGIHPSAATQIVVAGAVKTQSIDLEAAV